MAKRAAKRKVSRRSPSAGTRGASLSSIIGKKSIAKATNFLRMFRYLHWCGSAHRLRRLCASDGSGPAGLGVLTITKESMWKGWLFLSCLSDLC